MKRIFTLIVLICLLSNYQSGFGQCDGGNDQPNGDDCFDPITLCTPDDLPVSTNPWSPDAPFTFCGGGATTENNGWIAFVASASPVILDFTINSCTNGSGIQGVIFDPTGGCGNFTELDCFNPGGAGAMDFTLTANVIPGNTYYIMIDGYAGDLCDFTISVVQGIDFSPPPPEEPELVPDLDVVCQGDIYTFDITNYDPAVQYWWYSPEDFGYGPSQTIDFSDYVGEVEICVEASIPCAEVCGCVTIEVEIPPVVNPNDPIFCADIDGGGSILPYNIYDHIDELLDGVPPDAEVNFYDTQFALDIMDPVSDGIISYPGVWEFYFDVTTMLGCYVVPDNQPLTILIEDPEAYAYIADGLTFCWGDCIDLTDPTIVVVEDINNSSMPWDITFYADENSAMTGFNALDPAIAKADDGINPYYIRLETPNGCWDVTELFIEFDIIPELLVVQPDPECGVPPYEFDLESVDVSITNGAIVDAYEYYETYQEAEEGVNQIQNTFLTFDEPGTYIYYVVGVSPNGCRSLPTEIVIIFVTGPTATIEGDGEVCLNDEITLTFNFTGIPPIEFTFEDNHGNTYTEISDDLVYEYFLVVQDTGICTFTLTDVSDDGGSNCPSEVDGEANFLVHPDPELFIDGSQTICSGDTAFIVFNITGYGPFTIEYTDSQLGDITLNGITDGYVLALTPTVNTTITLNTIEDAIGCIGTALGSHDIIIIESFDVINIDETCNGNQYFVTFEITGGDPPTYEVFGDPGTLAGNMFTGELIDVMTPYTYYVTDGNACDTIEVAGQIDTCCLTMAGTMDNALIDVCVDETACATHNGDEFLDFNDALEFVLHDESGTSLGNIIAINDTPCFDFQDPPMVLGQTYYISAIAGNQMADGHVDQLEDCFQVSRGTPVVWHELPTATISQDGEICEGESYVLEVSFTGQSPFTFSYSADGIPVDTITTITNPFTITVMPSVTTIYTLNFIDDQFCPGSTNGSVVVTVNGSPIYENLNFTCNDVNTAYVATFDIVPGIGSNTYAIVDGPPGTNISGLNVETGEILSGLSDTVYFVDDNGCDTIAVPLFALCDCETDAGTMSMTLLEVCEDQTAIGTHNGDHVLDGNDTYEFILHEFSGGVLGNPIDTNSVPEFNFDPNTMNFGETYYISSIAGDQTGIHVDQADPCLSVALGQPVIFYPLPTAMISGDNAVCYNQDSIPLTVMFTGNPPFNFDLALDNNTISSYTTNSTTFNFNVATPSANGVYTIATLNDAHCDGVITGSASIVIQVNPQYTNLTLSCDTITRDYNVTFNINGGSGTYFLVDSPSSAVISGNTVTAGPFTSNTADTIWFVDENACDTIEVPFWRDCACLTFAGTMNLNQRSFCANESATAIFNGGEELDNNDVIEWVLHTNPTDSLGNIIAINIGGTSFSFMDPPMQYGVTYYISSVAGDNDGGGFVDLQDTCLSVSVGTPVVWYPYPNAELLTTNNNVIDCATTTLTLDASTSSSFNGLDFQWTAISGSIDPGGTGSSVNVSEEGQYQVIVIDQISGCSDTALIDITENNDAPVVDFGPPQTITCYAPTITIDAAGSSSGTDFDIVWTTDPPGLLPPGTTMLNPTTIWPGTYTLTITNTENFCESSESIVIQADQMPPNANAGEDQVFTCLTTQVDLDGSFSSQGASFSYQWTSLDGNQILGSSTFSPTVYNIGTYVLQVTNTVNGCVSVDTVEVGDNSGLPQIPIPDTLYISCYGENDGAIIFDPNNIVGGTPPYSFGISDGINSPVFTPFSGFYNLGPGSYTIIMQDVNGCTDSTTINLVEPDELQVILPDDITIELGDSIQINPIINMAVDTIIWSANVPYTGEDDILNPVLHPTSNTSYTITVIDANGCTARDAMNVLVQKDRPIFIPSAFSPNGDGINDRFTIYAGKSVKEIQSLRIYSRWGDTLFEAFGFQPNDETLGWDGTLDGRLMNPNVFVYYAEILFLDGEVEVYKGDVTLFR